MQQYVWEYNSDVECNNEMYQFSVTLSQCKSETLPQYNTIAVRL